MAEKPICSQIVSKLLMKQILRATGKRMWINALMVPVTMDARSDPRVYMEEEVFVEEETLIGARHLGCSRWDTSLCDFASAKTADGIRPILLGFILQGYRTSLLLISPLLMSFVSRLTLHPNPLRSVNLPLMFRLLAFVYRTDGGFSRNCHCQQRQHQSCIGALQEKRSGQ